MVDLVDTMYSLQSDSAKLVNESVKRIAIPATQKLTVDTTMQFPDGSGFLVSTNKSLSIDPTIYASKIYVNANLAPKIRLVSAGLGLVGGGTLENDITISANFSGTGSANTIARSDHTHSLSLYGDVSGASTVSGTINSTVTAIRNGTVPALPGGGGFLQWTGSSFIWAPATPIGSFHLGDLGDVQIAAVSDTQLLRYDSTLGKWKNWSPNYLTTAPVTTVFGRSGVVVSQSGDYNTSQVTENTNLYFTNARAQAAISGTAPISVVSGVVSHSTADGSLHVPATSTTNNGKFLTAGSTAGSLSWTSLTTGSLSELTSSVLTISGTGALLNSGLTIQVKQATTSVSGYLSSTDWNTFNNKQNALTNPVTGIGVSGQVTFWNGISTVTSSPKYTWDGVVLGIGLDNSVNNARLTIQNNTAIAGGPELLLAGAAGSASDTNSAKIYFGGINGANSHRIISTTESKFKLQRYDNISAYQTVFEDSSTVPTNLNLKFYGGATFAGDIVAVYGTFSNKIIANAAWDSTSGAITVGASGAAGYISFRRGNDGSNTAYIGYAASATESQQLLYLVSGGGGYHSWQTNYLSVVGERMNLSNSGNLTVTGNITGAKYITSGGTSSQFVKGDGTLDSTSLAITATQIPVGTGSGIAGTAYLTYITGTGSGVITVSGPSRHNSSVYASLEGVGSSFKSPTLTLSNDSAVWGLQNYYGVLQTTLAGDSAVPLTTLSTTGSYTVGNNTITNAFIGVNGITSNTRGFFIAGAGINRFMLTLGNDGLTTFRSYTSAGVLVDNPITWANTATTDVITVNRSMSLATISTNISFAGGSSAPTFTTRSGGTKVVLFPALSGATSDYAIGVEANNIWTSVPGVGQGFKWYQGITSIASLDATGLTASKFITLGGTSSQFVKGDGSVDSNTYLTANQTITLSGGVTGSGTSAIAVTLNNAAITGQTLTGYTVGANTAIAATDSILTAFQKAQAEVDAINTELNITNKRIAYGTGSGITSDSRLTWSSQAASDSIGIGSGALGLSTSGGGNTAFGFGSLATQVSAIANTGIGANALNLVTGNNNTAIGASAFKASTTGAQNTGIGAGAGFLTVGGATNTFIGYVAGLSNVSGNGNICLGNYAGAYNTGSNKFYVNNIDQSNTAGDDSNSILAGVMAATPASQTLRLNAVTTVSQGFTVLGTTTLGSLAGLLKGTAGVVSAASASDITGYALTGYVVGSNTAILAADTILAAFGKAQGQVNAINTELNIAANRIPYGTGTGVTSDIRLQWHAGTDSASIGIGNGALAANTTGIGNTAFGYQALLTQTTASGNAAFGYGTLATNTGNNNTAVGSSALNSNIAGAQNVGIGNLAGSLNQGGSNNTYIGYVAGNQNISGSSNICIGNYAGFYNTGSNKLYINNNNQANTANDDTNSIIVGLMSATPASQTLTFNAATTVSNTLTATSFIKLSGTSSQFLKADGSSDSTRYGSTIFDITSPFLGQLTGTTEQTMYTKTLPATALSLGSRALNLWTTGDGIFAGSGDTTTIRIYLGAVLLATYTLAYSTNVSFKVNTTFAGNSLGNGMYAITTLQYGTTTLCSRSTITDGTATTLVLTIQGTSVGTGARLYNSYLINN